jgi:hypothetical protein
MADYKRSQFPHSTVAFKEYATVLFLLKETALVALAGKGGRPKNS